MHIKGFGNIGINRNGKIEKIPFKNSISTEFMNLVKTKFKNGTKNDHINNSGFKFKINNDVLELTSDNGTLSSTGPSTGNTLEYKWSKNEIPLYMPGATDTNTVQVTSISLLAKWGTGTNGDSLYTIGTATITGSVYDYNDYVDYVSYSVVISMNGTDGTTVLPSTKAANSVFSGASGPEIKPTRLKIFNENDEEYVNNNVGFNYSDGHIQYDDLQIQYDLPPVKYELWVGNDYAFDQGAIELSEPTLGDTAWRKNDTINFQYITTAFD